MVRTDELLLNMMPLSVVAKLKEEVQVADQLHGTLLLCSPCLLPPPQPRKPCCLPWMRVR
jgi:hypothetical protein